MNNIAISSARMADSLLQALAEQLAQLGARYELFVIGGSALLALGLIARPTRDVDLVALGVDGLLVPAEPLPRHLVAARDRVARDFDLLEDWINSGPTSLLDLGLPEGFLNRVQHREYGSSLTVGFASRLDQIHFKLYAMVDQGPGKHEGDLRALQPTREELIRAAKWTRTHDASEGYLAMLVQALAFLGIEDADLLA
jgi:hypothetical protein